MQYAGKSIHNRWDLKEDMRRPKQLEWVEYSKHEQCLQKKIVAGRANRKIDRFQLDIRFNVEEIFVRAIMTILKHMTRSHILESEDEGYGRS